MQEITSSQSIAVRGPNVAHWIACCLVAVTGVLLTFGALVTTYEAAMAVPDWPGTYGHNMFLFPFAEWFYGPWDLFLEHGHRLLGASVGVISLILAVIVWKTKQTPAVRWLVVAAVFLVVLQGLLGGLRVLLDDKTVAKIHACTGPLFFSVAVATATLTSRRFQTRLSRAGEVHGGMALGSWLASGLMFASYMQLVAGAQLRHLDPAIGPNAFRWLVAFHLIGAATVVVLSLAAVGESFGLLPSVCTRGFGRRFLSSTILFFVCMQVLLGFAAWVVSWGLPLGLLPDSIAMRVPETSTVVVARSGLSSLIVTGHVVLGMMILGASVVLCILSGGLPNTAGATFVSRQRVIA
jgi:cytochrome c oxidase assembly protein subunit 15